jgi:uncharacterized protein YlaN (UPF0358 family)
MSNKDQNEILSEVLGVTRDQLSRSINLNAELEALLNIERRKVSELEQELAALKESSVTDEK